MARNANIRRANVKEVHVDKVVVKGSKGRRSSSTTYVSLSRYQVFRRYVLNQLAALGRSIRGLRSAISSLSVRTSTLEGQVGEVLGRINEIRQFFESRRGTTVSITTDAGVVTGVVTDVGVDYVRLTESDGDIVFVPLTEVNSTTP